MSLTDLTEVFARPDPALIFRWRCISLGFVESTKPVPTSYVENIDLFPETYDTNTGFRAATRFYTASFRESGGDTTIKFYEDENFSTSKWIDSWLDFIRTPGGTYNLPYKYKTTLAFVLLSPHADKVIVAADVIGAFPKSRSAVTFNSENDRVTIDVTFSVDDFSYTYPG